MPTILNRINPNLPALTFIGTLLLVSNCLAESNSQALSVQNLINKGQYDQAVLVANKPGGHYLHKLISSARKLALHKKPQWQTLIHYKSGLSSSVTSQVDGKNFFTSSQGKTNPQQELETTLASFFSKNNFQQLDMTPQCRFPARYHWLQQQLAINTNKLKQQLCKRFDSFKKIISAESLSIIFPSAHPNSPTSMFGHTLIRFDKKNQTSQTRMLAYSANYAAMDNAKNDISYAIKGLTGGFIGKYAMVPYYLKLREYGQMENRDLWEYKLNLNSEQVNMIVRHAFELEITHFDYYFFTENCSYHLLSLIEVAVPELKLTNNFNIWVIPIDTLKLLNEKNLIVSIKYYPSSSNIIRHKRRNLSLAENKLALRFASEDPQLLLPDIKLFTDKKQAAILDLAYDYLRFNKIKSEGKLEAKLSEDQRQLLLLRSQIKVKSTPPEIKQPDFSPDQGHETAKAALGFGRFNNENYTAINIRGAYHGLLDPADGFSPHSQIQFLDIHARYYHEQQDFKLQEINFIDIISLEPRDNLFNAISWRINTGWKSLPLSNTTSKTVFTLNGGPGLTYQPDEKQNLFIYGFVEAELNYSRIYRSNFQSSLGVSMGLLGDITPQWKVLLNTRYLENVNNRNTTNTDSSEATLQQAFKIDPTRSVNLDLKREKIFNQHYSTLEGRIEYYF